MNRQFIEKFRRYCDSNVFSDSQTLKEYLDQYTIEVENFNEKCGQLSDFLQKRTLTEAKEWFQSQNPSLQEEFQALKGINISKLQDAIILFDLPNPPELKSDIIQSFVTKIKSHADASKLILEYRKIATSNDILAKYNLAKEIVDASPDDKSWKQTRDKLELDLQNTLYNQAKEAILSHETDSLQNAYDALCNIDWFSPVRQEVVTKIERTLGNWNAENLVKELERLSFEDLQGNLEAMNPLIQQFSQLTEGKPSDYFPQELINRFQQIYNSWHPLYTAQLKHQQASRVFNDAKFALEQAISNQACSQDLFSIYDKLASTGLPIPEELQRRYETAFSLAQKHETMHHLMKVFGTIFVLAIAGILIFFLSKEIIKYRTYKTCLTRFQTACESPSITSAECQTIRQEIEKEHPDYMGKNEFVKVCERLEAKIEHEKQNHLLLQDAKKQLVLQLEDYDLHRPELKKLLNKLQDMKELITEDIATRDNLVKNLSSAEETWQNKHKLDFLTLFNELRENYMSLKDIVSNGQDKDYSKKHGDVENLLQKITDLNDDVALELRATHKDFLEEVSLFLSKGKAIVDSNANKTKIETTLSEIIASYGNFDFSEMSLEKATALINSVPEEYQPPKLEETVTRLSEEIAKWFAEEQRLRDNDTQEEELDTNSLWPGIDKKIEKCRNLVKHTKDYSRAIVEKHNEFSKTYHKNFPNFISSLNKILSYIPAYHPLYQKYQESKDTYLSLDAESFRIIDYIHNDAIDPQKLQKASDIMCDAYLDIVKKIAESRTQYTILSFYQNTIGKVDFMLKSDDIQYKKTNKSKSGSITVALPVTLRPGIDDDSTLQFTYSQTPKSVTNEQITVTDRTGKRVITASMDFITEIKTTLQQERIIDKILKQLPLAPHCRWLQEQSSKTRANIRTIDDVITQLNMLMSDKDCIWSNASLAKEIIEHIVQAGRDYNPDLFKYNAQFEKMATIPNQIDSMLHEFESTSLYLWISHEGKSQNTNYYGFICKATEIAKSLDALGTAYSDWCSCVETIRNAKPTPGWLLSASPKGGYYSECLQSACISSREHAFFYYINTKDKQLTPCFEEKREINNIKSSFNKLSTDNSPAGIFKLFYFFPKEIDIFFSK